MATYFPALIFWKQSSLKEKFECLFIIVTNFSLHTDCNSQGISVSCQSVLSGFDHQGGKFGHVGVCISTSFMPLVGAM